MQALVCVHIGFWMLDWFGGIRKEIFLLDGLVGFFVVTAVGLAGFSWLYIALAYG